VAWPSTRNCGKKGEDLKAFLSELAVQGRVAVATQKQALNALVFLFREGLGREAGDLSGFQLARRGPRAPTVLTRQECQGLFEAMTGTSRLMAELMYGSGLRLMELLRLRVKDVDLERRQVVVRGGKGDRVTMLPEKLVERLRAHRDRLRGLHEQDRAANLAGVWLPEALERKYAGAGLSWEWFWFFPSRQVSLDPHAGVQRRHHLLESAFQLGVRTAARQARLNKRVTPHRLRQLCHALARRRRRHPQRAGPAGACGCFHHANLHPRDEPPRTGPQEPAGCAIRDSLNLTTLSSMP
jgi:integrase